MIKKWICLAFIVLSSCTLTEAKDDVQVDGVPANPEEETCSQMDYKDSECSQACVFWAGWCAFPFLGARCYIYQCDIDSDCDYDCTGQCGWTDPGYPGGCSPVAPTN